MWQMLGAEKRIKPDGSASLQAVSLSWGWCLSMHSDRGLLAFHRLIMILSLLSRKAVYFPLLRRSNSSFKLWRSPNQWTPPQKYLLLNKTIVKLRQSSTPSKAGEGWRWWQGRVVQGGRKVKAQTSFLRGKSLRYFKRLQQVILDKYTAIKACSN